MAEWRERDIQYLQREMSGLRRQFAEVVQALTGGASEQVSSAYGQARKRARQSGALVRGQVRQRPVASLLTVAAAGAVCGYLLSRLDRR